MTDSLSLSNELAWRGFVNQTTFRDPGELDGPPLTFYWGVDPSAPSMTIGNLAAAMMVRHFIDYGHKAILLVGGATGMIGDPDGKSQERDLKGLAEIAENKAGIIAQYQRLFAGKDFEIVDNYDWFKDMNYLTFLRDVGKHVPMSQMLQREFVQSRLGEDGAGISYAEFSYALIQGYDFLHLFREKGATLQLCGSDQWGNSVAGVELIRRITGGEAHIWTTPLVINKSTGVKFGKSEDGAVWLDPNLTSAYKFYQFWLNLDDAGVEDYLKIYTMLNQAEIAKVMEDFRADRGARLAQKRLAQEVTSLVHGKTVLDRVEKMTATVFGSGNLEDFDSDGIKELRQEIPSCDAVAGSDLFELLVNLELAESKSEARRLIREGAIKINDQKCGVEATTISEQDFSVTIKPTTQRVALIRRGKNKLGLVSLSLVS